MRRKKLFSLLTILTLLISLTIAVPIAQGDGPEDFSLPEKQELPYPNLGSHLNQLAASVEDGSLSAQQAAAESPIHSAGSVAVTIHLSGNVDNVVDFLVINGGDPRNVGEDYIEAYVPVTLLGQLSEQPGVIRVREIIPPEPAYGNLTSQGVQTHLAEHWHDAGYRGQDIKVGIIDTGFEGFSALIGQELPSAPVAARCYTDFGTPSQSLTDCEGGVGSLSPSVHGTAVAETVIDIAPEVSLYISNPRTYGDLQSTVEWMAIEGVSVINHSVVWDFDGPGDGTSPNSYSPLNTVNQAVEEGIIWVNAAGNSATETWFSESPSIYTSSISNVDFVAFDGSDDITNGLRGLGENVRVQLRWDDSWDGASSDLDLRLFDYTLNEYVAFSEDFQTGESGHVPTELLVHQLIYDRLYGIVVIHRSGSVPDWVQVTMRGNVSSGRIEHYTVEGSISNPGESDNLGMLAVGATHYWDTQAIANYSSQGPTPDGRFKPDIVGTACGKTASYELYLRGGQDCWFSGTSQAAPHVAGLAALVRQNFPNYTPQQVAQFLKDYAEERGDPGVDNTWGNGFALLPPPDTGPAPAGCEAGGIAADGSPVSGSWGADCESAVRDGRYARYYQFTLTEGADITVRLQSDDAETVLYLREGAGATSGDHIGFNEGESPDYKRAVIERNLGAGTYTVEATTYDAGETGSFTLTVSGAGGTGGPAPSGCEAAGIAADGSPVSGSWGADCESAVRDGRYARYYQFTLTEGADITVRLQSDDAETVLYLREGAGATSGDHIGFNEGESPDYKRAVIERNLGAGTYTVEATTYDAGETGSFTLTVSGAGGTG